ncbi:hypothetical protein A2634_05380 [Candidatus Amesbacteria bacterium RIFCSPHIGHO2_01_FULL_48_32]|uniref:Type II secretion system protein GspG C-terminal domain-containing protein n=1 Tax=Candidatus Amesbacteria bacterium RIFCSPLOWO2_01_FULL_48_25 TaxID=1797259 RepID=A0A1F4ZD39_9BACT|nr:MAG: hypothetical protein A2634_05380 [Candidatus Amesbacteria bacterium RIFCSPHIGHO2_01_FULL_48_32]OGD04098.1 MAG: hypothetical protein A2989_01730 [Candidatus Amesbacteria bacterium RIFCSPLOWO2_01_FULL_48_25]HJZ05635.1 type II secretion system protein [Patescibacteria group bacterium]
MKIALRRGFTLIELLVVIGILAVLLAIVLIAINPARQFAQANNTKRSSDVNALLNAIHQYAADHRGNISALGIPSAAPATIGNAVGEVNICDLMVTEYIAALPVDPSTDNGDPILEADCADVTLTTAYDVVQSAANGRITVSAPDAEAIDGVAPVISVTR